MTKGEILDYLKTVKDESANIDLVADFILLDIESEVQERLRIIAESKRTYNNIYSGLQSKIYS